VDSSEVTESFNYERKLAQAKFVVIQMLISKEPGAAFEDFS